MYYEIIVCGSLKYRDRTKFGVGLILGEGFDRYIPNIGEAPYVGFSAQSFNA